MLLCSACSQMPRTSSQVLAAYTVQGKISTARVLTTDGSCPQIETETGKLPMHLRAPAAPEGGGARPASFGVTTCELALAPGTMRASVAGQALPLAPAVIERIVVIGDTGCRVKQSDKLYQACADAASWPFAQVARSAAALHPQLVIHVGDLVYRESPCPPSNAGCAGSPWGDGLATWQADFFTPATPLLAAAPWVFVRGNHEICARAGQGWFRFIDSAPLTAARSCADPANDALGDYSPPQAVPLGGGAQLIVFDSARVSPKALGATEPAYLTYLAQLREVDRLAAQANSTVFLSHHPALGLAPHDGAVRAAGLGLPSVMRALHGPVLYGPGIDLTLHGHVHLFEALGFATGQPPAIVSGNSGSASEADLPAKLPSMNLPFADTTLATYATRPGFGFALLERNAKGWVVTEHDQQGQARLRCSVVARTLDCAPLP